MLTGPPEEKKKALIVVRTYPSPSKKSVEASCTAAITDTGEWLRLFPIPYRLLPQDQRFRKYQWIEVAVTKARNDSHRESYNPKLNSLKILLEPLSTDRAWEARKHVISPLLSHCLCCLEKQRDANGYPTLGIFKPKAIERLEIKSEPAQWDAGQLAALRQGHLFEAGSEQELEKIPYSFRYHFRC